MRPSLSQAPALIVTGLSGLGVVVIGLRGLAARGRRVLVRRLCAGLLAAWLVSVLVLTLSGIDHQPGGPVFTLVPFAGEDRTVTETAGNVLMFVPGGLLLAVGWGRATTWRFALAAGLAVSVGIEVTQALSRSGRAADATDVFLNSAGAVAAYVAGAAWGDEQKDRARTAT